MSEGPAAEPARLVVDAPAPGARLDAWLRERYPQVSRATFQRLIDAGDLRVNGRLVKPSHPPRPGEVIEIHWPAPTPAAARPQDLPLEILFEDECLLVVNKPPGLVVHPAAGHAEGTLVNALLHHCAGQLSGIGGVARPGIVHRLDKDTSGCLVVAKDDTSHLALSGQFAGRVVEKLYHALVCGGVDPDHGEIHAAIARHPTHRKRMAVTDGSGREAWTSYRVLERLGEATLVEARIYTGRTHQVRVHFKHLGFPLVGDRVYGNRQNQRLAAVSGYTAPRHMLHARRLAFDHPRTARRLRFEAPWPADFQQALTTLRTSAGKTAGRGDSPLTPVGSGAKPRP